MFTRVVSGNWTHFHFKAHQDLFNKSDVHVFLFHCVGSFPLFRWLELSGLANWFEDALSFFFDYIILSFALGHWPFGLLLVLYANTPIRIPVEQGEQRVRQSTSALCQKRSSWRMVLGSPTHLDDLSLEAPPAFLRLWLVKRLLI